MAKPYSMDLRERVVAAVIEDGMSCHAAAARFGVAASSAIKWVRRVRETGSAAPGQMGGHKPNILSGANRDWLLERVAKKDRRKVGPMVVILLEEAIKARGEWADPPPEEPP